MITRKSAFFGTALIGYLVICLKFIPAVLYGNLSHIGIFLNRNSNNTLQEYIDYRRLSFYIFTWFVVCYLLFKIFDELKKRK
jgi:hypothetical protein